MTDTELNQIRDRLTALKEKLEGDAAPVSVPAVPDPVDLSVPQHPNALFSPDEVGNALVQCWGIHQAAADVLGCSRKAIGNYVRKYKSVRIARDEGRGALIDKAEIKLVAALDRDDFRAIAFTLSTLGKDRGYSTRTELTGAGGDPLAVDHVFNRALERTYGPELELEEPVEPTALIESSVSADSSDERFGDDFFENDSLSEWEKVEHGLVSPVGGYARLSLK